MARIRAIVLFELLVFILAAPSVQALPVQAPDGNSRALVSILDSGPMPGAAALAPSHQSIEGALSWTDGPEVDRAFWSFLLLGPDGWHDVNGAQDGNVRAPEPGTLLLVGAALAGTGMSIGRRRGRATSGNAS